jgi:hypothetical protein
MLGTTQTERITAASLRCVQAIKQFTSIHLKAAIKRALKGREPEQVYLSLNDVALKASVLVKMSEKNRDALRQLQSAYHAVVETWTASPSEKHRREMMKLFARFVHTPSRARKG